MQDFKTSDWKQLHRTLAKSYEPANQVVNNFNKSEFFCKQDKELLNTLTVFGKNTFTGKVLGYSRNQISDVIKTNSSLSDFVQ